jgi:hypothetical protein
MSKNRFSIWRIALSPFEYGYMVKDKHIWIADFKSESDARLFIEAKRKGKNKC